MINWLRKIFGVHSHSKCSHVKYEGYNLRSFILTAEDMLRQSGLKWDIEYRPVGDYYVIRVAERKEEKND